MSLYESESGGAAEISAREGQAGGGDRRARAQARLDAGVQQLAEGDARGARAELEQAVALAPASAIVRAYLAVACARVPDKVAAEIHARATLELEPEDGPTAHLLGTLLCEREQVAEGLIWLKLAARRLPEVGRVLRDLAAVQLFLGDIDAARANFLRALELDPESPEVTFALVRLIPMGDGSAQSTRVMEQLAALDARGEALPIDRRIELAYALGRAWEDIGDPDRSFEAYVRGATLKRSTLTYSLDAEEALADAVIARFDRTRLDALAGQGFRAARRPILIVGMPRSGTTLIEQILGAHPDVQTAGENPALMNMVAASRGPGGEGYPAWVGSMEAADCVNLGKAYFRDLPPPHLGRRAITDKRLENIFHLGLAQLCLDELVVVHCRRDPRDAAFACFAMLFSESQEYSYDFAELARYWRIYERLMAHWRSVLPTGRMLEIDYEALVTDPEPWTRRLVGHAGLDWDDACLQPHAARRPVRSASAAQVREPIHARGVGRWRPFAGHLRPLFDALGVNADD
jgi:Tfp pilus assembly protein PilF